MGASARAPVDVTFRETGLEGVQRGIRLLGNEGEGAGRRFGTAARQLAGGFETVARTGKVAGEGMKAVIAQAAEMAFMFGTGGAIAGALGVGALAIVSYFTTARKEIEETRKKYQEELKSLINTGDVEQMTKKARDVWAGTPAEKFKDGIASLTRELKKQQDLMTEIRAKSQFDAATQLDDIKLQQKEIDKVNAKLKERIQLFNEITQAITDLQNVPLGPLGIKPTKVTALAPAGLGGDVAQITNQFIRQIEIFGTQILPEVHMMGEETGKTWLRGFIQGLTVKGPDAPGLSAASEKLVARMQAFTQGIASAVQTGFTSLLDNIFGGGNVLAGLGAVLKQMGEVLITFSGIMEVLAAALTNPFTAGPAAFAAGVALVALGSALGAAARGGGSRGGGSYGGGAYQPLPPIVNTNFVTAGANAAATASRVMPIAPVINNYTIIGPDDARAFRMIQQGLDKNMRRG